MTITPEHAIDVATNFFAQRFAYQVDGPPRAYSTFNNARRIYATFGFGFMLTRDTTTNEHSGVSAATFDGGLLGALEAFFDHTQGQGDDLLVWRVKPQAAILTMQEAGQEPTFDDPMLVSLLRLRFRCHTMKVLDAIVAVPPPTEAPCREAGDASPVGFNPAFTGAMRRATTDQNAIAAALNRGDGVALTSIRHPEAAWQNPENDAFFAARQEAAQSPRVRSGREVRLGDTMLAESLRTPAPEDVAALLDLFEGRIRTQPGETNA